MKKFLIILTIVQLSCGFYDQEVYVDLPEHDSRLVLNSVANTRDSLVRFLVTQSYIASSSENVRNWVNNASLSLSVNGIEQPDVYLESQSLHYISPRKPQIGDVYDLTISAPGFDAIHSNITIPDTASIVSAKLGGSRVDEIGEEYESVLVKVNDNPDQENYYSIQIFSNYSCQTEYHYDGIDTTYSQSGDNNYPLWLSTPQPWLTSYGYGDGFLFSDRNFVGGIVEVEVWIDKYSFNEDYESSSYDQYGNLIYYQKCEYDTKVEIKSISRDLYEYLSKLEKHEYNQYPDLFSGEPVPMPTNIENGFGIFGAMSVASRIVDEAE